MQKIRDDSTTTTIEITYELTLDTETRLQNDVLTSIEKHTKTLVVDIKKVNYIDSTALGMFIHLNNVLLDKQIDMVISNPSKLVYDIFTNGGFDLFLRIER